MADLKLYSAAVCPYAHRTRLVLLEKGLEYQEIEIDLNHKPANFQEISPYGKVPVLKHGDIRIWESTIINEYLEDVFSIPALLPGDPGKRALARIWIDFANTKLTPTFYKLLLAQEPEKQQELANVLKEHLQFMEQEGISKTSEGRAYWLGNEPSLVDFTFYPWFERWIVLAHYRNFPIPKTCEKLLQWQQAMSQLDSVKSIQNQPDFYIQKYIQYANNTASGITAQEMRQD